MSVELNNESGVPVDEAAIQRLVTFGLDLLHVHPDADVAILFVDEAAMEQLHVQWMDEPGPTDVLSFPMDELRPGTDDALTPAGLLGDIVVCPQVAEAQAKTAGHSVLDEIEDGGPVGVVTEPVPHVRPGTGHEPVEGHRDVSDDCAHVS